VAWYFFPDCVIIAITACQFVNRDELAEILMVEEISNKNLS